MKKKILFTIALLCIIASLANYFYYTVPYRFEIREAAWIEIFNGATGEHVEITDAEVVAHITENLNAIEFRRGKREKIDGYAYTLIWHDANNKEIETLHFLSGTTVIKHQRRYQINNKRSGVLDLNYINELFLRNQTT